MLYSLGFILYVKQTGFLEDYFYTPPQRIRIAVHFPVRFSQHCSTDKLLIAARALNKLSRFLAEKRRRLVHTSNVVHELKD